MFHVVGTCVEDVAAAECAAVIIGAEEVRYTDHLVGCALKCQEVIHGFETTILGEIELRILHAFHNITEMNEFEIVLADSGRVIERADARRIFVLEDIINEGTTGQVTEVFAFGIAIGTIREDFDETFEKEVLPYKELLRSKPWNLMSEPEEVAVMIDGAPKKCAVAHNLGQVRKLLEGDYKNYDVIRLMA